MPKTNGQQLFPHRMAYDCAQDLIFKKCQREKCVWPGVTFMKRRACEMRKVAAQALLSLVAWSK
jgi:hypothetical protein